MRVGYVYLLPADVEDDLYGVVPYRVWYRPWRWKLIGIYLGGPDVVVASNLRRSELVGLMKMLKAYNIGE